MRVTRHITTGLQLMMSPDALIPFLIGAIALAILGNAAFEWVLSVFGRETWKVGAIASVSLAIVLNAAWLFSLAVSRAKPGEPLAGKQTPQPRKGLIVLVSNEGSLNKALEYHASCLQYCWLVCSGRSAALAEATRERLIRQGKQAHLVVVDDVYDPLEVREKVASIYEHLPAALEESDVILDFTGMTAIASVGSVLACLNTGRPIEYVPAELDKDGKITGSKNPIEIVLDYQSAASSSDPGPSADT